MHKMDLPQTELNNKQVPKIGGEKKKNQPIPKLKLWMKNTKLCKNRNETIHIHEKKFQVYNFIESKYLN